MNGILAIVRALVQHHVARATPVVPVEGDFASPGPPHPIARYEQFLGRAQARGVLLGPLPAVVENKVTLSLRHDVDADPDQVRLFRDAEKRAGVRSSFYFIVDEVVDAYAYTYPAAMAAEIARELRRDGFLVGLHSIAWAQADGVKVLAKERERFKAVFGFRPESETFHGFLDPAMTARLRRRFNASYFLRTGAWFEGYRRVVLSDSEGAPLRLGLQFEKMLPGIPYEFMTHPQYWCS